METTTADVVERPTSSAPAPGGENPSTASDRRDDDAEYEALEDAGHDVGKNQGVARINEITGGRKSSARDAEEASAQYAHEVGPDGKAGNHDGQWQKI